MKAELKQLGLSENEVDAYLKLLSSGEVPVSVLAYKMKLPRNTCRYICHQLIDKNLVSTRKDGNTFLFQAEPADKLYYLIEQQEKELQKNKEGLNRIINELKAVEDPNIFMPRVSFEEGAGRVIQAYQKFFSSVEMGATVYNHVHAVSDDHAEFRDRVIEVCVEARSKKNIHAKCLSTDLKSAKELQKNDKMANRETRSIKRGTKEQFAYEMLLYEDTIFEIIYSKKGIFSTTTKNEEIAKMRLSIFLTAWDSVDS